MEEGATDEIQLGHSSSLTAPQVWGARAGWATGAESQSEVEADADADTDAGGGEGGGAADVRLHNLPDACALELRPARPGDRFHPAWRERPVGLAQFLRGQGVPLEVRREIRVLALRGSREAVALQVCTSPTSFPNLPSTSPRPPLDLPSTSPRPPLDLARQTGHVARGFETCGSGQGGRALWVAFGS